MGKGLAETRSLYRKHQPNVKDREMMQTSLEGIANKAKSDKKYRFRNLYGCLNEEYLKDCFGKLNQHAASGVDRISYREYEEKLNENVTNLVERLKRKSYRAKLIRRCYIPKDNGKQRPLGIPAIEDKLLQYAVSRILQAIWETDFLPSCFGYRENRGAKDAVEEVNRTLYYGPYHYVVEADIKDYFGTISHEWMERMLEQRIDDKAFVWLIRKWLKAGVLDTDGQVLHPESGTPQGGSVSPVLATIYLHYCLNLWFEHEVKNQCRGKAFLCVYADDFVTAFEYKEDAEKFYGVLGGRLGKFELELSVEKTNLILFSKRHKEESGAFDFLGFEFRWKVSDRGKDWLKRSTSKKKCQKSEKSLKDWIKENRHVPQKQFFLCLNSKLRGYYNYYGVQGNQDKLGSFHGRVLMNLYKWLNRRSQRRSYCWSDLCDLAKRMKLVTPWEVMRNAACARS
jgi:group II intron reverse transcriptase/maturase